jgi:hypothetical protein
MQTCYLLAMKNLRIERTIGMLATKPITVIRISLPMVERASIKFPMRIICQMKAFWTGFSAT